MIANQDLLSWFLLPTNVLRLAVWMNCFGPYILLEVELLNCRRGSFSALGSAELFASIIVVPVYSPHSFLYSWPLTSWGVRDPDPLCSQKLNIVYSQSYVFIVTDHPTVDGLVL